MEGPKKMELSPHEIQESVNIAAVNIWKTLVRHDIEMVYKVLHGTFYLKILDENFDEIKYAEIISETEISGAETLYRSEDREILVSPIRN